jgi:DNA-binding NarL/FixJ family response regulator
MPITVALIEDDRGTREALSALLSHEPSLKLAGTYASAEEALAEIPKAWPDVLLSDIKLQGRSGIECAAALKAQHPRLQVLMLTTYEDSELIFDSLRAGASGYVLKKTPPAELIQAIEQVHGGGAPMSMEVARKVIEYFHPGRAAAPPSDLETLTPREEEILALLAGGCLYKEIGERLDISLNTVRTHLKNIYEKLHVQSRGEATLKYLAREGPSGLDRLKDLGRALWPRRRS